MSPRRAMLGVSIAAAVAANACSTTVEPIQVAAACPDQPLRRPDESAVTAPAGDRLIDDFEDGDVRLAKLGGRTGAWTLGLDNSPGGNVVAEASSHCSARGGHAGHFVGSGFSNWGANWTAVFLEPGTNATPYDARAFSGISFWAAAGADAMEPLEAPVGVTTVDVAWNGGVCTSKCMDYYGVHVPLTRSWQRITIKFADLAQNGWGAPQTAMKHDQTVGFIIWPNHQFDIWIDDVQFEP